MIVDVHGCLDDRTLRGCVGVGLPLGILDHGVRVGGLSRSGIDRSVISGPGMRDAAVGKLEIDAALCCREFTAVPLQRYPDSFVALDIADPAGVADVREAGLTDSETGLVLGGNARRPVETGN